MTRGESLYVVTTSLETFQLRREPDRAVPRVPDIQRNYSKRIASDEVLVLGGVIQDEAVHPIDEDFLQKGWAVPLVKVEQDLTVAGMETSQVEHNANHLTHLSVVNMTSRSSSSSWLLSWVWLYISPLTESAVSLVTLVMG